LIPRGVHSDLLSRTPALDPVSADCSCATKPGAAAHKTAENKKGKGRPYSIAERRVPELIPVLGSQPAGDVSHKPGRRLPLLSARPAVTLAALKKAATSFAAW